MGKRPILIIDPMTGRECYTKHPENLIQRRRAVQEAEQLKITAVNEEMDPLYWNGSPKPAIMRRAWLDGCDPGAPLHRPGEVRS